MNERGQYGRQASQWIEENWRVPYVPGWAHRRDRGQYGVRHAHIGAEGFGGSGFGVLPRTELDEIDDAAKALEDALQKKVLELVGAPQAPSTPVHDPGFWTAARAIAAHTVKALTAHAQDPRVAFYTNQWIPWRTKWKTFYDDQTKFLTELKDLVALPFMARSRYFDAQPYRASLIELYQKARALGFAVPEDPAPPNVSATSSLPSADDLVKYAKYGAIALAAVLGVVVISNVATATRGH